MMKKRSVTLQGHRTSITLEPEFWQGLEEIARARGVSLQKLLEGLDEVRRLEGGLASALRVYVLRYFRDAPSPLLRSERGDPRGESGGRRG